MIWALIGFSALTAFLFRLLPFFLKNNILLHNQEGTFYRFLSYSAQAVLGVIIYNTAFHEKSLTVLLHHFNELDCLKLVLLGLTFFWVAKSKKILPSFFFSLVVYFIALTFSAMRFNEFFPDLIKSIYSLICSKLGNNNL